MNFLEESAENSGENSLRIFHKGIGSFHSLSTLFFFFYIYFPFKIFAKKNKIFLKFFSKFSCAINVLRNSYIHYQNNVSKSNEHFCLRFASSIFIQKQEKFPQDFFFHKNSTRIIWKLQGFSGGGNYHDDSNCSHVSC